MIGDPDQTDFPGNPAFLSPITLLDPLGTEVLLEAHPSLADAWRPAVLLVVGTHTFGGAATSTAGTLESTDLVDDIPPATPSIVSIEPVDPAGNVSPRSSSYEYIPGE